jgi:hypothetical protein
VRNTLTNLVEVINRDSAQSKAVKVTDLTRLHNNAATRGHVAIIVSLITASVGNPRLYGTFAAPGTSAPRAKNFTANMRRYTADESWSSIDSSDPGTRKFFGFQSDGFETYPGGTVLSTLSQPTTLVRQVGSPTTSTMWLSPQDRMAWKRPCRVATTGNVATLAGGAPSSVDGVTVASGDRILVWQQSAAAQNGIYEVYVVGTGANGTWVRASDWRTGGVFAGARVYVQEGTAHGQSNITVTTTGTITVGSTSVSFLREVPHTDAYQTEVAVAPNQTLVLRWWAHQDVTVTAIQLWADVAPTTAGTYTFAADGGGSNLLDAATFDLTTLVGDTLTNMTLTGVAADLQLSTDEKVTLTFASNNVDLAGVTALYARIIYEGR